MKKGSFWKNYGFLILMLTGIVAGCVVGAIWPAVKDASGEVIVKGATVLEPLGTVFLNLMFCIAVPTVFCSISSSIANMQSAKRAASCNFLIFIFPQPFPAWLQSCAGNLFLALPAPVGRAFSVCAPCPPCREADIHKKFISAALRLSALLYIINAEHIPVSPLPITERFG